MKCLKMNGVSDGNTGTSSKFVSPINHHVKKSIALLLLLLLISFDNLLASDSQAEAISHSHNHLSWTVNTTRYDFVFNTSGNLSNILKLESDSNNYLTDSLPKCNSHAACLFRNGQLVDHFQSKSPPNDGANLKHWTIYSSTKQNDTSSENNKNSQSDICDSNEFRIIHYCSTNWNPPAYLYRNKCSHTIEWHSPLKCDVNSINHEKPCYIYDPKGRLIDLTPWIKSDGSSYKVNVTRITADKQPNQIKGVYINVCNEAHDFCGPNVAACFINPGPYAGLVDAGFNNLTSIKYDAKENGSVSLISQGYFKEQCEDSRFKTVIRFVCKKKGSNKSSDNIGPELIRANGCENVIEWETIHACPVAETKTAVLPDCKIKYDPLGIDIDVRQIIGYKTTFEVPQIGDSDKKMILGVCKSLPKDLKCEGKKTSSTSACLVDTSRGDGQLLANGQRQYSANNSQIVGTIIKSTLRLADDRLYLETNSVNRTCSTPVRGRPELSITKQIGVRIEFVCSPISQLEPKYLGFEDCTYIFEFGSPLMCFEALTPTAPDPIDATANNSKKMQNIMPDPATIETLSQKPPASVTDGMQVANKTATEQHKETLDDAAKINAQSTVHHHDNQQAPQNQQNSPPSSLTDSHTTEPIQKAKQSDETVPSSSTTRKPSSIAKSDTQLFEGSSNNTPKMNSAHKYFMISLIIVTLVAFFVVIFVLDKKTRLGIPFGSVSRRVRQSFQAQPVPYSRFVNDLDL